MSTDYVILARLTKPKFRILVSDHPKLLTEFQHFVFRYQDPNKVFIFNVFERIKYLQCLSPLIFHRLLYSLVEFTFDENEILLREGEAIVSMIIIKNGELEVVLHIDGGSSYSQSSGEAACSTSVTFFYLKSG